MHYSTITSKGQVTIPAAVRDLLHLESGSKLEFIVHDNVLLAIPINKSVLDLEGILPKTDKSFSCEEIDNIIRGE
jgi:antitoxin PrlF